MTSDDDDYVYDELRGEWRPASELAAEAAAKSEVRDAPEICWPMAMPLSYCT